MGDLERLMRAVRTIERLAWKHDCKDAAAVLMEHCSCKDRDAAAFAGYWLVEVWELNRKAHQESNPRCVECGDDVEGKRDVVRSDASYCSPACRQRAYRKRVTAPLPAERSKRNGNAAALRLPTSAEPVSRNERQQ